MLDGNGHRIVPIKGQSAGEHLIKNYTGRIDIAAVIGVVPLGLLRGDVVNRSNSFIGWVRPVGQARNTEIRHLHGAVPQNHDILGLDIPVNDAPTVGVAEALHNLGNKVKGFRPVQAAPALHILLERNAVNELHNDIVHIAAPGHVIHRHDVGVRQHSNCLGLIVKPAAELGILREILFQHLDGHKPVETVAPGLEHHRHTPGTDDLQDLIAVIQHLSYVTFHSKASFLPWYQAVTAA